VGKQSGQQNKAGRVIETIIDATGGTEIEVEGERPGIIAALGAEFQRAILSVSLQRKGRIIFAYWYRDKTAESPARVVVTTTAKSAQQPRTYSLKPPKT
jgi:hypothetical protein